MEDCAVYFSDLDLEFFFHGHNFEMNSPKTKRIKILFALMN